jgi:UDP-N-acetylmuramate--alanine ligase
VLGSVSLQIPGRFNVANALAAASAALALGVPFETVQKALAAFPGIWRRFERLGECDGAIIISDYAHHPTSVRGTIAAAREFYPERKIVAVFQPHQRNRTKKLFEDFVRAFAGADTVVISDIYEVPGREETEDRDISSRDLVAAIQKERRKPEEVIYGGGLEETERVARDLFAPNTIVLVMGAGDIYTIARELLK